MLALSDFEHHEADYTRDPGLLKNGVVTLKVSWLIIFFLMESEIVNKLGHILWKVHSPGNPPLAYGSVIAMALELRKQN